MKFSYLKFPLDYESKFFGKSILRPIIPITINFHDKSIRYAALIDSGADFCIFDAEVGEYLGLVIENGIKNSFGGIQEKAGAIAYLHTISINIGGWDYTTTVGFSYDIAKHGHGILGQKGFFDLFIVKFDYQRGEIELKEKR